MIKNNLISDQELFRKVKQNDIDAFEILYERYAPILFPAIKQIVKDHSLAEKVLTDSFLIFWRWAEEFDFEVKNVFTWMMILVRTKAIDTARRESGNPDVEDYTESFEILNILPHLSPEIESIDRENILKLSDEISKIVRGLTGEQQKLFLLVFYNGYDMKSVANKLGIPSATIKPQIQQIIEVLMQKLVS